MRVATLSGGVWRGTTISSLPTIYDQTYSVGSTITTGTAITLPASGTYSSAELEVYLNGQVMSPTTDYAYVGSIPRTQITLTFDAIAGDLIRFKVMREV